MVLEYGNCGYVFDVQAIFQYLSHINNQKLINHHHTFSIYLDA